ncbi:hypothetical protein EPN87_01290 [archaeon]|nr:MAG: hypothetical protein EPN87_01290 [archaeon]
MKSVTSYLEEKKFHPFLIFLVIFIVFFQAFFNQFKADDSVVLYAAQVSNTNINYIFTLDLGGYFRPLNRLLFIPWYDMFSLDPLGYHIVNILLFYFVDTLLVYILALEFTNKSIVALASSLIFATLATHFDTVMFLGAGLVEGSLFTFFLLTSFISFVKWNETDKRKYLLLSLIMFIFTLLSYEGSVVLLPIMFMYLVIFSNKIDIKSIIGHIKKLLIFAAPFIPYLAYEYIIQKSGWVVKGIGIYYFGLHFFINLFEYLASMFIIIPMIDIRNLSRASLPYFISSAYWPLVILTSITVSLISIYLLLRGSKNSKFFIVWFGVAIFPFLFWANTPIQSSWSFAPSIGTSILFGMFLYYVYQKLSNVVGSANSKMIVSAFTIIFILVNSAALVLIENYKFNNGVSDESVMMNFLKSKYPTFPDGSKLYFVNDSMPFHDGSLAIIMSVYYHQGTIVSHNISIGNGYAITIYYPANYVIYEITRDQVSGIPRDNSTHIFDYIKTDFRPGNGIELS